MQSKNKVRNQNTIPREDHKRGVSSCSAPAQDTLQRTACSAGAGAYSTPFLRGFSLPIHMIIETFPEQAKELIPKEIARLNKIVKPYKDWMIALHGKKYDDFTKWFIIEASRCLGNEAGIPIKEVIYLDKLKKMKKVLAFMAKRGKEGYKPRITQGDIERAKAIPITLLINCVLRGQRYWAKCPFHASGEEHTPSMLINRNNTFKCFSCQARGDAIQFIRDTQGLDFIEAVEYLKSY